MATLQNRFQWRREWQRGGATTAHPAEVWVASLGSEHVEVATCSSAADDEPSTAWALPTGKRLLLLLLLLPLLPLLLLKGRE
jgi:hypothetical protein